MKKTLKNQKYSSHPKENELFCKHYNFGMLVIATKCFNRNSILYIYICVHMSVYLYKECCCKYKGLNFIIDTDGELLKLIVKVI